MKVRVLVGLISVLMAPLARSADWKLVWSDEFGAAKGRPPEPAKWAYDLGGGGWGNRELQRYSDDVRNVSHDGKGHLIIRVIRAPDGSFTSARLKTQGKAAWEYGKIEARIKVPFGQGIWPAFWALGTDFSTAGWPKSGEIDVMENIGKEPSTVHGTVHGPGYSGGAGISSQVTLRGNQRLANGFHVFGVVWSQDSIEFFFDGRAYRRLTPAQLPQGATWAFNHPFFLLLNVAVGGEWPGNPDETTTFPQEMTVDWIRVWQRAGSGSTR